MKKWILGMSLALLAWNSPNAIAHVQPADIAESESYYLLEHRIRPCEVWVSNGRGDFVCANVPRRRYVADSRTFADAIADLDQRVRELEERVRELEAAE